MRRFTLLLAIIVSLSFIAKAQSPPVATNDSFVPVIGELLMGSQDTTISFNLLENDYDPDEDPIKIKEIYEVSNPENVFTINDSSFLLTISGGPSVYTERMFKYRICEVDDVTSDSEWAFVNINPALSADAPVAKNDSITLVPGHNFDVNVLNNDINTSGGQLYIEIYDTVYSNGIIEVGIDWDDYNYLRQGELFYYYTIGDTNPPSLGLFDIARVYIKIATDEFYDSLNINNINALYSCFGHHFWDMPGGKGAHFYVPNGGTSISVFSNTLWIGGLDNNNELHLAAERYRQVGIDYWHGPVSDVYDIPYDSMWFYMWNLNNTVIEYHKQNWWKPDYECPHDILTWPGNGDVNNGQAAQLAPYHDADSNGIYEPLSGDWPRIRGDQALFFIFNDARDFHSESKGENLGIEIHGMAYAFDAPADSALWNTVFLHYDIINRSKTTYSDTYVSSFTDIDLGYAGDDYIGSDVQGGFYYGYNGVAIDGSGEPQAYGEHPPAMGVMILGGPNMDNDDIDNPSGGCDESINGLNFGDAIVDNERLGMTRFSYFNNGGGAATTDPQNAPEYYNFLKGFWKDNSPVMYGGNGHTLSGAVGPECKFMFPGDSDTCNWGTSGFPPNGGFNQNGYYWTEETVGNNPSDRRGLGVSGPFTFKPGDVHQLDLAFVYGRDFDGTPMSSVEVMKQRCYYLKDLFVNNPDFFSKIESQQHSELNIRLYPNPADNSIILDGIPSGEQFYYAVYDLLGNQLIYSRVSSSGNERINIRHLQPGLYIIRVYNSEQSKTLKLIKE